jgi:hypothetical protein
MALTLKSDRPEHAEIPKEYKLNFVNMTSTNTFIFSEKDQEGFKPHAYGRSRADRSTNQGPKNDGNKVEKRRRRGIPSTIIWALQRSEDSMLMSGQNIPPWLVSHNTS